MIDRQALDPATLPGTEERSMLRDSLRGFLETHWPAADAVVRATRPDAVAAIWSALVDQGVASLGSDPTEGGLREIVIAMEEMGRAACPAPLLGAVLANLALSDVAAGASAVRDERCGAKRCCDVERRCGQPPRPRAARRSAWRCVPHLLELRRVRSECRCRRADVARR